MSATLNVYAISFERLRRVPGSRDSALVGAIGAELEDFLGQIDRLRDDPDEDEEADEVPTCLEAVGQIVDGAPLLSHLGYLYGYAFEAICAHLGRELPGISGIVGTWDWAGEVDEVLRGGGMPVGLNDLIFGRCPIQIPAPDDVPCLGSWPPEVIPGALQAIRSLDLDGLDPEMTDTIAQVRRWLEAAAEEPGLGLVGVLS